MTEKHELMGGKLHVYRRENSGYWQCSTYLAGKNWRVSTKEESLAHAKEFAEDWYLGLRGKSRAGAAQGRQDIQAGRRAVSTSNMKSSLPVSAVRNTCKAFDCDSGFICFRFLATSLCPKSRRAWCRNIASIA